MCKVRERISMEAEFNAAFEAGMRQGTAVPMSLLSAPLEAKG